MRNIGKMPGAGVTTKRVKSGSGGSSHVGKDATGPHGKRVPRITSKPYKKLCRS